MSETRDEAKVWPWAVGAVGLAVVLGLAVRRGPAAGSAAAPMDDAAQRAAAAAKEAADATHGPVAGPPPGELIHDEAREARALSALGLSREAWDALDEATQRAKASQLLVARGGFDVNDASSAVGAWARADILSQLAPLFRDAAGIASRNPYARRST